MYSRVTGRGNSRRGGGRAVPEIAHHARLAPLRTRKAPPLRLQREGNLRSKTEQGGTAGGAVVPPPPLLLFSLPLTLLYSLCPPLLLTTRVNVHVHSGRGVRLDHAASFARALRSSPPDAPKRPLPQKAGGPRQSRARRKAREARLRPPESGIC